MSTGTAARKAKKPIKAGTVKFSAAEVVLALHEWWKKPSNANKSLSPHEKIFPEPNQDWTIRTVIVEGIKSGIDPGGNPEVQLPPH